MWGWGGVSVDPKGRALFVGIGNSHVFDSGCDCFVDDAGYGNAMVKLSLDLRVLGWHRPPTIPNTGDSDFGSAPLLFQPPGCPPLAAANNKNGCMYVWHRDQLGKGTALPSLLLGEGRGVRRPAELLTRAADDLRGTRRDLRRTAVRIGDGVAAFASIPSADSASAGSGASGRQASRRSIVIGDVVFAPRRRCGRLHRSGRTHGPGPLALPDRRQSTYAPADRRRVGGSSPATSTASCTRSALRREAP